MRYLSLFSGIEAATLAWAPLGWSPVAFSEVDPFCCALLKHYWPDVPNLGDVCGITDDMIQGLGQIDLVMYGFPCTDLSIAGDRKGLRHDDNSLTRSGLFYEATRIVRSTARLAGCKWFVFENVPGLFSSNGGRDFAEVIREITGLPVPVPEKGWQNSGVVRNHQPGGWHLAWRTLDGQYFGVPQRRRRIFTVGHTGDWTGCGEALLEKGCMSGHPPTRREKRAKTASRTASGANGGIAGCLNSGGHDGGFRTEPGEHLIVDARNGTVGEIAPTVQCGSKGHGTSPNTLPLFLHVNKGRPDGRKSQHTDMVTVESDTIPTVTTDGLSRSAVAFVSGIAAYGGGNTSGPIDVATCASSHHKRCDFDTETFVLDKPLAFQTRFTRNGRGAPSEIVDCLTSAECGGHADTRPHVIVPAEIFNPSHFTRGKDGAPSETCPPLSADADKGDQDPVVRVGSRIRRLTVLETERLQGLPDNHTLIPFRGKPASDTQRYRAVGNSIVVPNLRWIGQRIDEVQRRNKETP